MQRHVVYMVVDDTACCLDRVNEGVDAFVSEHCYQREGTRHITLCEALMTCEEAERISLDAAFEPFDLEVDGAKDWPSCVALVVRDPSGHARALCSRIRGLRKIPSRALHISLYRRRGQGLARVKHEFEKVRNACNRLVRDASVTVVDVRCKPLGAPYEESRSIIPRPE
jgi:hypothetical protein